MRNWMCWDCGITLPGKATFCDSCERHRADRHDPVRSMIGAMVHTSKGALALDSDGNYIPLLDERGRQIMHADGWCHGSGPRGTELSKKLPAPIKRSAAPFG